MWEYQKKLQFPINIKNPDPKLAAFIVSQYGGAYCKSLETPQTRILNRVSKTTSQKG